MPNLEIYTNVRRDNIPGDFFQKLLPVFAQVMNMPEELLFVTITPDVSQVFEINNSAPTIVASISSVGGIGPAENRVTARALTDFLEQALGVNRARILLSFTITDPTNVARSGNTFA